MNLSSRSHECHWQSLQRLDIHFVMIAMSKLFGKVKWDLTHQLTLPAYIHVGEMVLKHFQDKQYSPYITVTTSEHGSQITPLDLL